MSSTNTYLLPQVVLTYVHLVEEHERRLDRGLDVEQPPRGGGGLGEGEGEGEGGEGGGAGEGVGVGGGGGGAALRRHRSYPRLGNRGVY